jgi:pyruvate ferredoxin oxidoreductase alpha subunit
MEDAEYALVGLGSMMGTTRVVVDQLREEGIKAGMLSVKSYRPFPVREVRKALRNCKAAGVLDRDVSFGTGGILYQDISRCLVGRGACLKNFIVGLAGRDVTPATIRKSFGIVMDENVQSENDVFWPDENAALWQAWRGGAQ